MTVKAKVVPLFESSQFSESTEPLYLGPAQVKEVAAGRVTLEASGHTMWAHMALAFPYQPTEGDTVLVVGQGGAWYVIGVLNGSGKTTLTAPGDIEFRAPNGQIDIVSAKGIRLRGPTVRIAAEKLELVSKNLMERYESARRWVKGALELRAGRARVLIDKSYRVKAGRIVERAQGDVKIDGRKIHLG